MPGEPKQFSSDDGRSWERVIALIVLDVEAEGRPEVEVLTEVRCERLLLGAAIGRLRGGGRRRRGGRKAAGITLREASRRATAHRDLTGRNRLDECMEDPDLVPAGATRGPS